MEHNIIKILALETATDACSAALLIDERIIERYKVAPKQHAMLILPMVQDLLAEAQINLSSLHAIAFGCGPGSFTGVRIAAGVAQGLAFGANLPVVAISTLQALAFGASVDFNATKILAMLDARMGQVYFGKYQLTKEGYVEKEQDDSLVYPEEISLPKDQDWIVVGNGGQLWSQSLFKVQPDILPRASSVARLAKFEWLKGNIFKPEQAIPVYLRNKVVGG